MAMRLDPEIDKVEARIMRRRHELTRITQEGAQRAKESGQRAVQKLTSPGALAGAAVIGFLVGGGAVRRHQHQKTASIRSGRRRSDPAGRAAKRTGVIGALVTGAMWLVRAKFGSPAGLATYLMARRRAATSGRHGFR
jgi:hypothetical protein